MFEGWNIPRRERRWFNASPRTDQTEPEAPRCRILPPGWRRMRTQAERDAFALEAFHPGGAIYDPNYRESQIFQKTDGHCAYCWDKPATTIDHIKPSSRGGTNSRSNLIGACCACNGEKAAMSLEDFRAKRGVTAFPFENYETRNTRSGPEAIAGRRETANQVG
jgi:hypothetical protein